MFYFILLSSFWNKKSKRKFNRELHKQWYLNPFPHTTILQQTTLNIFCQNIENLHNWMDNLWQKVENIVAKGEIASFVQFLLLSLIVFSKRRLLQRRQKASIWGKGLTLSHLQQISSRIEKHLRKKMELNSINV